MEGKVAVSGYFNPLHIGHLTMFREAKKLGDYLIVIVNNDYQVELKGSIPFMSQEDRCEIVSSIKGVDKVILSIDEDATVCKTLSLVRPDVFAKGGDRKLSDNTIPEVAICEFLRIRIVDNVCPQLRQSSLMLNKYLLELKLNGK